MHIGSRRSAMYGDQNLGGIHPTPTNHALGSIENVPRMPFW
jgi:hypothetical protein